MSLTPFQEKNKIVIAVAGSGKTTSLVRKAIESPDEKRILFLTYTNENLNNIKKTFLKEVGYVPSNVEIVGWFTFLLRDGVRPYHNSVSNGKRAMSVNFIQGSRASIRGLMTVPETNTERYYFDSERKIYTDVISKFVFKCNEATDGLVINRLEQIYSSIFIDEVQDLAGWDLDFLKLLMNSKLRTRFVGDPRQVTYSTNHAPKNRQYRDENIVKFFLELQNQGICEVQTQESCLRCNQVICDLANRVFPHLPSANSDTKMNDEEDGIIILKEDDVPSYIDKNKPIILRYNKNSNTLGYPALNYGASKGSTFERVLIFPTKGMEKFLKSGNIDDVGDKAKFYVAITRARHSVAFVIGLNGIR